MWSDSRSDGVIGDMGPFFRPVCGKYAAGGGWREGKPSFSSGCSRSCDWFPSFPELAFRGLLADLEGTGEMHGGALKG